MSQASAKREKLLAREQELIRTALKIMAREGAAGLTMDKVVERVPYSKGTVYNHFCSREDLLTAICNAGMERLAEKFTRAIRFQGTTRERLLATHYAYLLHALLDPIQYALIISAKTTSQIERTSEQRLNTHYQLEKLLMGPAFELVTEAIDNGDLVLPPRMGRRQVVFCNWASCFGTITLLINNKSSCGGRFELDIRNEVFSHANLLLDGLQWRALSSEQDYEATLRRIETEIFPRESALISQQTATVSTDNPSPAKACAEHRPVPVTKPPVIT
ncbi:TetR/AcrR family transcriptional regulator [Sedimenticola thiotaurini]|uniref:TetR/AcrR family transcriptional regulator n=1 Tax=Sedimenticola thiotaurini TaxID=1543721 RepID=UPI00069AAA73|nr:TetR/AcrR family transcriptional regulator [Sedimenticola thiotaurini]